VTQPKKRGCLGCSFPVLIIVIVITLAVVIVGFLAGSLGQKMLGIDMPSWLVPEAPDPHLAAPVIFHIGPWPITNSILATWLTVIVLVLGSWLITRRMKLIPGRLQMMFEAALGWVYDLCVSVAGETNGRKFFPVIATIFLFVLFNAWLSLLPGFVSILVGHHELFRGANTDVNTPLAIALVSFVFVAYFGLKEARMGYVKQYINLGGLFRSIGQVFKGKVKTGLSGIFSGAVDAFVGGLELLSMFIRIISFTFRLFGNMTAGEILLLIAVFLVPMVLALPFYGLELLVGFVQAFIFSGLTLVFVTMAVTPHGQEAH
jgi:F-type H+-transporting ATPase subunit a